MLFGIDRQFGIQEQSTIRRISGKFIGRKINNWTKCLILLCLYSTYGGCTLLSCGGCIENSLYVAFQTNSSEDKWKTETVPQMLYSLCLYATHGGCIENFQWKPRGTYSVFSLTWPASMQIYSNKRKRLHKKRVQRPQDWFGRLLEIRIWLM